MNKKVSEDLESAKHTSYWISTTPAVSYKSELPKETFDVAIVGGGIVGIALAYFLNKSGKKVIVVEAEKILEGVTGFTTAKITSLHTLIYDYLINKFGKKTAKLYADAQQSAIEEIALLVKELKIDCDFIRAQAYTYTEKDDQLDQIKREAEAAKSLGLPAVFTRETDLPYLIKGAVRFDNQAHFHPRKFLLALAKEINNNGSLIIDEVRVKDVKEGEPSEVITEKGVIKARDVVIATNYPILDRGLYFTRLTPKRSYVLGVYIEGPVPKGMYITIDDPLFSLRPQPTDKGDMLIVTGFNHQTGHGENSINYFEELAKITRTKFKLKSIAFIWATHDNDTVDRIPYIGKYLPFSEYLFVATGFAGWGMTNGITSAKVLHDLIMGKKNAWSEVFNPARRGQLKDIKQFVSQNIHAGKKFVNGRLLKEYSHEINQIKDNEGKVIELEGQKVAVYKDEKGKTSAVSAVCRHLGCIVNFNNTEKSWDCPCHGSRYDVNGKILHDPTVKPLPKIEDRD